MYVTDDVIPLVGVRDYPERGDPETIRDIRRLVQTEIEKKAEESVSEMAVRLNDVFRRWTRSCATVEQLAYLMVREQLVNTCTPGERQDLGGRKKAEDYGGGSTLLHLIFILCQIALGLGNLGKFCLVMLIPTTCQSLQVTLRRIQKVTE